MSYTVKSPILFLIFNRPVETKIVFNAIREAKPSKLYIAADGPRTHRPGDDLLCQETRNIVKDIDWDCEVNLLFSEENSGCKIAVSNSITWFFNNEPEGIVLEDDCLPNENFFEFCDTLLEKYRDDTRIRHISGSNMNLGEKINNYTYYFSKLTNVWGWASWRRVWKDYDVSLKLLDKATESPLYKDVLNDNYVTGYIFKQYKLTQQGEIDTWDYQYAFSNIINNGLCIIPNYNMISNIGFNNTATHTTNTRNKYANMPFESFTVITHPVIIIPNTTQDVIQIKMQMPTLYQRVKGKIGFFIKKVVLNKF